MEYDAKELVCHPRFQPIGEAAFMVSFGDAIHPEILRCASALVEALKDHLPVRRKWKHPIRESRSFMIP